MTPDEVEDEVMRFALLEALVARRIGLGMSQRYVGQMMGVTQSTVSDLENRVKDPRLSSVQRYARAVGACVRFSITPDDASLPETKETPGQSR